MGKAPRVNLLRPIFNYGWDNRAVIDIFIPYWGQPQLLFDAVESVRSQTSSNWRLTVVDDCYPVDVADHFASIDDPRVRYMRNDRNLGIIENFSKCQDLAEGKYTVIMGCDDLLLPNYIDLIERIAQSFVGTEIIQPGVEVIDANGLVTLPLADRVKTLIRPHGRGIQILSGEHLAKSLLLGDWLYWPSLAFETKTLKSVEFLPDYQIILDLGLILDMVQGGARMAVVPDIAFAYRRHEDSLSSEALLSGPRFKDEDRFFKDRAAQMDALGWKKAARSARLHLTSRAYALTLLPAALRQKSGTKELLTHAFQ